MVKRQYTVRVHCSLFDEGKTLEREVFNVRVKASNPMEAREAAETKVDSSTSIFCPKLHVKLRWDMIEAGEVNAI